VAHIKERGKWILCQDLDCKRKKGGVGKRQINPAIEGLEKNSMIEKEESELGPDAREGGGGGGGGKRLSRWVCGWSLRCGEVWWGKGNVEGKSFQKTQKPKVGLRVENKKLEKLAG